MWFTYQRKADEPQMKASWLIQEVGDCWRAWSHMSWWAQHDTKGEGPRLPRPLFQPRGTDELESALSPPIPMGGMWHHLNIFRFLLVPCIFAIVCLGVSLTFSGTIHFLIRIFHPQQMTSVDDLGLLWIWN